MVRTDDLNNINCFELVCNSIQRWIICRRDAPVEIWTDLKIQKQIPMLNSHESL